VHNYVHIKHKCYNYFCMKNIYLYKNIYLFIYL